MIRIRDVAQKLNLSITTVSRALDGYDDVAETTRQLVVRTASEMGYTPNRAARQLRRQRAEAIGYILPVHKPQFADPFFSEFIAGLGDETTIQNYDLLVSSAAPDSAEEQATYQRWVQGGKVDGIIVNRIYMHDWRVQYLTSQKIPFVCFERSLDTFDFIGVESDSYTGFLELMAHLTNLHHTRIAYVGGLPQLKIEHDRFAGYKAGLAAAQVLLDPLLVMRGDLTSEAGYQAAEHLLSLDQPPTAIVCINDLTAIGAMHAAHNRGLTVGRDIAIAGFDGIADSAHTQPPLTTMDQPLYAAARQLARMLLAQISGDELHEKQVKIYPKLIIRASTGG